MEKDANWVDIEGSENSRIKSIAIYYRKWLNSVRRELLETIRDIPITEEEINRISDLPKRMRFIPIRDLIEVAKFVLMDMPPKLVQKRFIEHLHFDPTCWHRKNHLDIIKILEVDIMNYLNEELYDPIFDTGQVELLKESEERQ
tara:strand:- start:10800 stop:11231 length:432 start_codon:yes stop_codon:yes gene_type:complete